MAVDPTASSAPPLVRLRSYLRRVVSLPPEQQQTPEPPRQTQSSAMQRSAVFGSCAQSVGIVASVLFAAINRSGHVDESARDSSVTRQAKVLYVSLLESVQKQRGEWQGFSASAVDPSSSSSSNNNDSDRSDDTAVQSPRELLTASITSKSTAEQLSVLNELLEVSFRNLMGPLVPLEQYARYRKMLQRESLAVPPALTTLLAIRGVLDRLEREVRHCLLRLLALWDLVAIVSGEAQPLLKTIADKHHHVFSESSEFESMISPRLIEEARANAWPPESEPAAASEEDDKFSSDGDISSSLSDENQALHDGEDVWGIGHPSAPALALRSRATSSVPSLPEDGRHQSGEYYYEDGEDEESGWSIPSPTRYSYRYRHQDRETHRSRSLASPPVSGGAGPLVPVPMTPSSSEGIPPPNKAETLSLVARPMKRVPNKRRHSQRSLSTTHDSPTHSVISQANSGTKSSSRKTNLRSSSSLNGIGIIGRQQREKNWQDTTSSESRSPPPQSRPTARRSISKRLRGSKSSSIRRRRASTLSEDQVAHNNAIRPLQSSNLSKPAGDPSILSLAVSYLTIPVAAATLCVIATMTTLAIYETRKAPRN
ncbi:unnamed protein product [Phytophthora fragariaefolia]|uniref:Unnamed protein product n=1 Tax=Phytophthora fragariaefolia TaxID=1490495 RepID=A0A9W6YCW6_9STRA|nr:unnamed protein product [Phytophthora fragariaefolia]